MSLPKLRTLRCFVCRRAFRRRVRPGYLKRHKVTCSTKCANQFRAKRLKEWWKKASPAQVKKLFKQRALSMKDRKGPRHPAWRGGRIQLGRGYVMRYDNGKHKLEHRVVMEKILGRKLASNESVHHRNGRKNDNRPKNLLLVSTHAHWEEHGCPKCGFTFGVH